MGDRVIGRTTDDVLSPYHRERSEPSPDHPITTSAASNHPITATAGSNHADPDLRTIAWCRMMRAMSGTVRSTTTSSAICVISITETTMITVPAGPEGRD
jgi:hypothetical protein